MKSLSLFLLLAAPLHAELLATFATTRGSVIVSLHFDKTPQTVANFITLAQGTRGRIDPATGAVIRKPLYAGETFYKVVTDPFSGGYAQTGSGTGTTNGGPGYIFRDEFDASLPHGPYILAMQNEESPHTNGSQIYFTGENGYPPDAGKNTVFGSITDETSKSVIRSILAAGNNGTTINSIGFQRTSQAALAFNEHAQNLPVCEGIKGRLEVTPGESVSYALDLPQPAGSFFLFARSLNLQGWGPVNRLYQAAGFSETFDIIIDDGVAGRAFYNIANVRHPDALAPDQSLLAGETLSFNLNGGRTMVFDFENGEGGTLLDSSATGAVAFTVLSYSPEPYKAVWRMETSAALFEFRAVLNGGTATQVTGTCVAYEESGGSLSPLAAGTLTLTRTP
jgi:cyclophilin family peptidyl-prolyl cis-trans isomerase